MAKQEVLITQSLLDRLSDIEPWPESRKESIAMFRQSLKRDVESLLNTRKPILPAADSFPLTSSSVLFYGLPDSRIFDGGASRDPATLSRVLRGCIEQFEPRIQNPQVTMTFSDTLSRSLRFQVEGTVRYEDMEEEIQIDTVLELISGEYEVD